MNESEGYSPWFLQGRYIPVRRFQDFKIRGGAWYEGDTFARCGAVHDGFKQRRNKG
jgi:hypothetical protein